MKSFREKLFTYRGYMPIPFLLVMFVYAQPSVWTVAIGAVIIVVGEMIRFWAVAYAGGLTRVTGSVGAPEVIVSGPFAYVRNPIYIGNITTYAGFGIMANALFPWLLIAAIAWFVFQYHQIVFLEESFLEKEFGKTFIEYKKNVPRFLPKPKAYVSAVQSIQLPKWKEAVQSERRTFQALTLVMAIFIVLWYLR